MNHAATMCEMRKLTQHSLNVCHVYCRLVDMGVKRLTARHICTWLERTQLYHLLYADAHVLEWRWWVPRIDWRLSVTVTMLIHGLYFFWTACNTACLQMVIQGIISS